MCTTTTAAQQQRTARVKLSAVLWSTVRYSSLVCFSYYKPSSPPKSSISSSYSYHTYLTMTQFPLTPCSRANAKPKSGHRERRGSKRDRQIEMFTGTNCLKRQQTPYRLLCPGAAPPLVATSYAVSSGSGALFLVPRRIPRVCVGVLHIKPFFLSVDIQHNQCPRRFFNPRRGTSSVVTKLRHR